MRPKTGFVGVLPLEYDSQPGRKEDKKEGVLDEKQSNTKLREIPRLTEVWCLWNDWS